MRHSRKVEELLRLEDVMRKRMALSLSTVREIVKWQRISKRSQMQQLGEKVAAFGSQAITQPFILRIARGVSRRFLITE